MENSLLAVRDINHKYIVVEKMIVENGITYVLGENDIYYPDIMAQLSRQKFNIFIMN